MADEDDRTLAYEARCAAVSQKGTALIFSIDRGNEADIAPGLTQMLDAAATDAREGCWNEEPLDELLPHKSDGESYPFVETELTPRDANPENVAWEWALKLGFARDRVMAYADVKSAQFAMEDLTATPELVEELEATAGRARLRLELAEDVIRQTTPALREDPEQLNKGKRMTWARDSQHMPDAQRQQPIFEQSRLVLGQTGLEIDAQIMDPYLDDLAEHKDKSAVGRACKDAVETASDRDAGMGRELLVSFVFPNEDHAECKAAACTGSGIRTATRRHAFPAWVTVHSPTGMIRPFPAPRRAGKGRGAPSANPNSFVTPNAAELLAELHALTVRNGRVPLLLEHAVILH